MWHIAMVSVVTPQVPVDTSQEYDLKGSIRYEVWDKTNGRRYQESPPRMVYRPDHLLWGRYRSSAGSPRPSTFR